MSGQSTPEEPEIGSLAEEATKLVETIARLARDHGAVPPPPGGTAYGAGDADSEGTERPADGPDECTVCPVCRTVHVVRAVNPEVRAHLSAAWSSLTAAAGALLSTQAPGPSDEGAGEE